MACKIHAYELFQILDGITEDVVGKEMNATIRWRFQEYCERVSHEHNNTTPTLN